MGWLEKECIHAMPMGTSHHEGAMPRRAPAASSRSSVYPYTALHFVAAGNSSKRLARSNDRRRAAAVGCASVGRIPEAEKRVERRFPRERLHSMTPWLRNDAHFVDIEARAARACDAHLRVEPFLDGTRTTAEAQPSCFSDDRTGGDFFLETCESSSLGSSIHEEAYVHRIRGSGMVVLGGERKRGDGLAVVSRNSEPGVGDAAVPLTRRDAGVLFHQPAEPSTSMQQRACNTPTPACGRGDSASPIVVKVMEVEMQGSPDRSASLSSPCIHRGMSPWGSTEPESSHGDRAVSLRDASTPRGMAAGGSHFACATEPYHTVRIPRPHYILLQVNFSSWQ